MRRLLATGLLVLLVPGCATAGETPPAGEPATPAASSAAPAAGAHDPAGLIGVWTLAGTSDDPGAVVRVGESSLKLFRNCAILDIEWRADPTGLFVAHLGGHQVSERGRACRPDTAAPVWVNEAVAFRADGQKRILLDARGRTVAEWAPGGKPEAPADLAPADVAPPVVSEDVRRALGRTAKLPPGLTAAAPDRLAGRWVPAEGVPAPARAAHVELSADGSWSGSDGCNAGGGRWAANGTGALLVVAGAQTEVGCDNSDVMAVFGNARAAGFDGDLLVLAGLDGTETGRLRRQQ